MIESIKTLDEQQQKFVKKIQDTTNVTESFKLHDKYYKWLHNQFDDKSNSREVRDNAYIKLYETIYQASQLLERFKAKEKDVAVKWNGGLVMRIGKMAEEKAMRNIKGTPIDESFVQAEGLLYDELYEEMDLATVCYCFSVLKRLLGTQLTQIIEQCRKVAEEHKGNTITVPEIVI